MPCHLLALPIEVRAEIYRHLFTGSLLSTDIGHHIGHHSGARLCTCSFPWQITKTCQQLKHEATHYLLSATTLEISSTIEETFQLAPIYLAKIPRLVILNTGVYYKKPLDLKALSSLKVLELRNITVWCKYYDEADLLSPNGDERMIQLALFNLYRINTQLMQSCFFAEANRTFKILLCCHYVVSSRTHETIVRYSLTFRYPRRRLTDMSIEACRD